MNKYYQDYYHYCPNCGAKLTQITDQTEAATCSNCGFTVYNNPALAVGVIIVQQGKMLLAKRKLDPFKGYWDTPGGFIDVGESPEQACIRELKEETHLKIEVNNYISAYPDHYQDNPTLVIGYEAEIIEGNMKAEDDVAELNWFPLDKLPTNLAFDSINQIIADYLSSTK
jgi:8-oxo-dGTP diphosphatase